MSYLEYNVILEKARLDGKVQKIAYYINENTLIASHNEMDREKAKGIDGVSKDDYSINLKANVEHNYRMSQKLLNESYSIVFADFYLFDKIYGINYKGKETKIQKYLEILQLIDKAQIQDGKFGTIKLPAGQKKRLALLVTYLEDIPIYLMNGLQIKIQSL